MEEVNLISYDLAYLAKEKGFNYKCLYYYQNDKLVSDDELTYHLRNGSELYINWNDSCFKDHTVNWDGEKVEPTSAPTYQQIVDWFRVNHGLVLDVYQEFNEKDEVYTGLWALDISKLNKYENPHIVEFEQTYPDYYQAWNILIEEAFKLI